MQSYQQEQLETLMLIRRHLNGFIADSLVGVEKAIAEYLAFRREVAAFLKAHFSRICTQRCYRSNRSACCTKEGIITFFAEAVINVLVADGHELDALQRVLASPHIGNKCIYLGAGGCIWRVKPLVCEMFLCNRAEKTVFTDNDSLLRSWNGFKEKEKSFRWPDRPVLFDTIEDIFLKAGYASPLMYLHNSPGLLRIKKMHAETKPEPTPHAAVMPGAA